MLVIILIKIIVNWCINAVKVNHSKDVMINKSDVVECLDVYKGLIFSELDKNVNTWSVVCENRYKKLVFYNFGCNNIVYENVNDNVNSVMCNVTPQKIFC